jgi:hypothetical protein
MRFYDIRWYLETNNYDINKTYEYYKIFLKKN